MCVFFSWFFSFTDIGSEYSYLDDPFLSEHEPEECEATAAESCDSACDDACDSAARKLEALATFVAFTVCVLAVMLGRRSFFTAGVAGYIASIVVCVSERRYFLGLCMRAVLRCRF